MIINANTIHAKDEILKLIGDEKFEGMEQWLAWNLGSDYLGVWLMVNKKPTGLGMVQISESSPEEAYIFYLKTPPGVDMTGLLEKIEQWSKEKEIKKLNFLTKSRKTGEKYGFKFYRILMTKEL